MWLFSVQISFYVYMLAQNATPFIIIGNFIILAALTSPCFGRQRECAIWLVNVNHTENPIHTVHKHYFVFTQKISKFQFARSCQLTVCVQFANPIHIQEHLVYEQYVNSSVCKCVQAFKFHYSLLHILWITSE